MSDVTDVTVSLPEDVKEEIESRLEYGDSRSEWIRDAYRRKLEREAAKVEN